MEKIREMVGKYNLTIWKDEMIKSGKDNVPSTDIEYIKENKAAILEYIRTKIRERVRRKKEEINKKYAHLEAKLPIREITSENDDEKAQEIIKRAEAVKYYSGAESDGLNLAVSAGKTKLYREARKYCAHELKETMSHSYTHDGRKELTRIIECEKCKLYIIDVVSDPVRRETALSM